MSVQGWGLCCGLMHLIQVKGQRNLPRQPEIWGCFTYLLRALQDILSKFVYCRNRTILLIRISSRNFVHVPKGTHRKIQLEIHTISVIFGILYFCSGAHFTNGVWAHDSKLLNKSLSSYFDANAHTKPYICTYHDSSVLTCAKFLLDWTFFIVYFTWLNVINHLLCKRITYFYKTRDHKLINYMWNQSLRLQ